MFTRWTSHLRDPEHKERFQDQILSAKPVLNKLLEIIEDQKKEIRKIDTSENVFTDPNWAYKQAYHNGQKAGLDFVAKLIDLDKQEKR